ncbi:YoaK family protein [Furfurilactobacillus rossiae]|nr:YoaK family protein [Furfurilactobacillus rossiae]MCF6166038.1 DUF1275 domain-containing protein [Furfurilactobacillus rossiae]QFR67314.1 DUF1275 domain-containing protein [Furfurilactobacillus rossiae]QLE60249.1 integral membrane protein [Furfurilactobacillus rossiae]QLE63015.1 integral membrane protein [Furfurilactobacillus rossiae]
MPLDKDGVPQIYQLRRLAVALTMVGGFIDAYTFEQRGGSLAAMQTGNIIFLSVDVAKRNLPSLMTKVAAILFFSLGVLAVSLFKHRHNTHYWRIPTLLLEMLVCIIVGFEPRSVSDIFAVPPLAMVMAMQTTAFNAIEGHGYNSVYSTGNLKMAMIAIGEFHFHHNRSQLISALLYLELVVAFAAGAIISALLQLSFNVHAIWFAAVGILLIIVGYSIALHQKNIHFSD